MLFCFHSAYILQERASKNNSFIYVKIPEVSLLVSYKVCFLVWISVFVGHYFRAENKLPFCVLQLGYTVTVITGTSLVVVCMNVPVCFWSQQQYSSVHGQLHHSLRCLQYYVKLVWESPTTEDTNFHPHYRMAFSVDCNCKFFQHIISTTSSIQGIIQAFPFTGLLWWQKLHWFFLHFLHSLILLSL